MSGQGHDHSGSTVLAGNTVHVFGVYNLYPNTKRIIESTLSSLSMDDGRLVSDLNRVVVLRSVETLQCRFSANSVRVTNVVEARCTEMTNAVLYTRKPIRCTAQEKQIVKKQQLAVTKQSSWQRAQSSRVKNANSALILWSFTIRHYDVKCHCSQWRTQYSQEL